MNSGSVKIYSYKIPSTHEFPQDYLSVLSSEEIERGNRFYSPEDQCRYFWGKILTRRLLSVELQILPKEILFSTEKNGRPILSLKASDIDFNISHTENYIAIALARSIRIGIDIESKSRSTIDERLVNRFFTSHEAKMILSGSHDHQWNHFFKFWTLKEAFIKAEGSGMAFGLNRFDVALFENYIALQKENLDYHKSEWYSSTYQMHPSSELLTSCAWVASIKPDSVEYYYEEL